MPTTIAPFTKTPSRQAPATFSVDMDSRLSEENSRIAQMNLQSGENNASSAAALVSENNALASKNAAANSELASASTANFKGTWTNQTTALGESWLFEGIFYRVLIAGNTSPTATPPNWVRLPFVTMTSPTGAVALSAGTTAERPLSPLAGWTRFNTTLVAQENYNGTAWVLVSPPVVIDQTASNIYLHITQGGF